MDNASDGGNKSLLCLFNCNRSGLEAAFKGSTSRELPCIPSSPRVTWVIPNNEWKDLLYQEYLDSEPARGSHLNAGEDCTFIRWAFFFFFFFLSSFCVCKSADTHLFFNAIHTHFGTNVHDTLCVRAPTIVCVCGSAITSVSV